MIININTFKNKIYLVYILNFILGIFLSFSLPPYNIYLINFFVFPILFITLALKKNSKSKNFFIGWIFGFGYFISNLYWITNSLSFEDQFKKFIPLALILVPGFLAIFFGLATFILSYFNIKKNFSSLVLCSLIIAIFEFLRGYVLTGFPWNLFVYSISDLSNILYILSFIGTYSLNLLLITLFFLPVIFLFNLSNTFKLGFFSVVLLLIIISNNYFNKKIKENYLRKELDISIKIVSPKIEINRYFENQDPLLIIKELISLIKPRSDEKTIFIFPEGILSGIYLDELKEFKFFFEKEFNKNHKFIFGINSRNNKNIYNSLALLDHEMNLIHRYDKNNLVPFGEFLPFENLLSKFGLKKITEGYKSYTSSNTRKIIKVDNLSILPLICYEIIYSGDLSNNSEFDIILNISEDGWFGNSIGPHQHFVHSLYRSIEEGKTLIRSSNNGTSAIIDPIQGVINKIESTNTGVLSIQKTSKIDKTIFSQYGNKIFFYFVVFYISLIFILKRKDL